MIIKNFKKNYMKQDLVGIFVLFLHILIMVDFIPYNDVFSYILDIMLLSKIKTCMNLIKIIEHKLIMYGLEMHYLVLIHMLK